MNWASILRTCEHCGLRYDWRKSPSTSLKMLAAAAAIKQAGIPL